MLDNREKAKLVAFARLLEVDGTTDEVISRFEKYEKEAFEELSSKPMPGNTVEVGKRPF